MDSRVLAKMMRAIADQGHDIDGVMVIRNGYIVAEAIVHPYRQGSLHKVHSCTKSIVSVLIGIAIDKGYIEGPQQAVTSFFPDRTAANLDDNKKKMTLEHLLTMS